MPRVDIPIYANQSVQTVNVEDIPQRIDVLFTNNRGETKERIRKRKTKALDRLRPALHRVLQNDETVLFVTDARSPLSILEQLTAAWWTYILAATAIVITNKRILFLPTKHDGSWRESVRVLHWGDLQEVKANGLLVKNVVFQFKGGARSTYTNFHHGDGKKLATIAAVLIPAATGEPTGAQGLVQLCPDCRTPLTAGQYSCPNCKLIFKNEQSMILRSIFLPAGGYFYTGHSLIAILPAIFEGLLILDILFLLRAGLNSPVTRRAVFHQLIILGVFWAFETAVTILHCRRYIRDFIPEKRDPARVPNDVTANLRA
jgi:hypothetical protein